MLDKHYLNGAPPSAPGLSVLSICSPSKMLYAFSTADKNPSPGTCLCHQPLQGNQLIPKVSWGSPRFGSAKSAPSKGGKKTLSSHSFGSGLPWEILTPQEKESKNLNTQAKANSDERQPFHTDPWLTFPRRGLFRGCSCPCDCSLASWEPLTCPSCQ